MVPRRTLAALAMAVAVLGAAGASRRAANGGQSSDPLADEIRRWTQYVNETTSKDEFWSQIKPGSQPALDRATEALRDGRRLLALQRLTSVRVNLAAFAWVAARAEKSADAAGLEAEWKRMGARLAPALGAPRAGALSSLSPAVVRALGETALPQVREFYDASLEYGRSTTPASGFFYLGQAQAQRDLGDFLRRVSKPSSLPPPALRPIGAELDALEAELLAAYRPPASLDRHSEFIGASSTLKEARELDAAGLRFGAMLRYLQASQRVVALHGAATPGDPEATSRRLSGFGDRAASGGVDHTIAMLFIETARADLEGKTTLPPGAHAGAAASVIASDVLPRYFAALEPAKTRPAEAAPAVTVTLVRWPYT